MSKPYNCMFFVYETAMPIYAYKCAECSHEVEAIRKVSDPPLTDCPNCGKPTLVKQVTAAGFQLKGGGWYVTDFRDQGAGKKKGPDKAEEKLKTDQAESGVDAKADTKPDKAVDAGAGKTDTAPKAETKEASKSDGASKPAAPSPAAPQGGGKTSGSPSGTS